jgi:hypothetical protein
MLTFQHLGDWGRLGNQLFKYASMMGIARNNNLDFVIPPKSSAGKFADEYQLNEFRITAETSEHINDVSVHESDFSFDENLFNNCPDNVNLEGGFQSYKYFEGIKDEVRNEFRFRSLFNKPTSKKYTVIHVRRGDYAKDPEHHPMLSADYYKQAMEMSPITNFIVVSDDVRWCVEQDVFRHATKYAGSNIADLFVMTQASAHIIANSTFSWWGAYLAESESVIAPKQWFGPALSMHDTKDLKPKDWIEIDAF